MKSNIKYKQPLFTKSVILSSGVACGLSLIFCLQPIQAANKINAYNCELSRDASTFTKSQTRHQTTKILAQDTKKVNRSTAPTPEVSPSVASVPLINNHNGITFLNNTYDVGNFTGSGQVPNDGRIYEWHNLPNWYLVEKSSAPGKIITNLQIGDAIQVKNKIYHVYHIDTHQSNSIINFYYLDKMLTQNGGIGLQTCEKYEQGSPLIFYFAK